MCKLSYFQINQDIALQQTIIKYKVYIEIFFLKCKSFLSGFK